MYFMYPSCYSESRLTSPNKPVSPSPFLLTSCLIGLASPHRTPLPPPAARRATLVPRDPHCPARSEPPCKLATQHTHSQRSWIEFHTETGTTSARPCCKRKYGNVALHTPDIDRFNHSLALFILHFSRNRGFVNMYVSRSNVTLFNIRHVELLLPTINITLNTFL